MHDFHRNVTVFIIHNVYCLQLKSQYAMYPITVEKMERNETPTRNTGPDEKN